MIAYLTLLITWEEFKKIHNAIFIMPLRGHTTFTFQFYNTQCAYELSAHAYYTGSIQASLDVEHYNFV